MGIEAQVRRLGISITLRGIRVALLIINLPMTLSVQVHFERFQCAGVHASGPIMRRITRVTIWVLRAIKPLTKSPAASK